VAFTQCIILWQHGKVTHKFRGIECGEEERDTI